MEKLKLKSGREINIKDVSLDERDELLDSIQYELNNDGSVKGVKMMHSTMTKWLRTCLEDGTDDFILGLSLDDKSEIFTKLQTIFFQGEGKASK